MLMRASSYLAYIIIKLGVFDRLRLWGWHLASYHRVALGFAYRYDTSLRKSGINNTSRHRSSDSPLLNTTKIL